VTCYIGGGFSHQLSQNGVILTVVNLNPVTHWIITHWLGSQLL